MADDEDHAMLEENNEVEDVDGEEKIEREERLMGSSSTILLKFSIDFELLDCNICFNPLKPPLFQCANGHVTCFPCSTKLGSKCCICSSIASKRCIALEEAMEGIKVPCMHFDHGCRKMVSYVRRDEHEKACDYAPCTCPFSICNFQCHPKSLADHIRKEHSNSPHVPFSYSQSFNVSVQHTESFVVLEGSDKYVFLLLNSLKFQGNRLWVVCLRPAGTWVWKFSCDLTVQANGKKIRLKFEPANVKDWCQRGIAPTEPFLFIPRGASSGVISVNVRIKKTLNFE